MANVLWYDLAKAFRAFIPDDGRHYALVTHAKCNGDDFPSAFIRVWRRSSVLVDGTRYVVKSDHPITDTILFREDAIECTNIDLGHHEIDLCCPDAYEQLLVWMKRCDLTDTETMLTGDLACPTF